MKNNYRSPLLQRLKDELIDQTPRDERLAHTVRAEQLLEELEGGATHPYEFYYWRITLSRADSCSDVGIPACDARHDLGLLVEEISDSANVPVESVPEAVLTVEDLAKRFHVSAKTISRWRQRGLVGRRFLRNGRKRLGFLGSSVDRFVHRHAQHVHHGARFHHLTPSERSEMIQRARTLAQAGLPPAEILRVISGETARSSEAVRMTIRRYDRQHPETAVLANHRVPARQEADEELYAHYRRGESVSALAFRHGRPQSSVQRAIRRIRAQRIAELPLAYLPNPEFARPDAEKQILGPAPEPEHAPRKPRVPAGIPAYLASLYEVPLLSPGQEKHLFRRFNYLKYRAVQLREKLHPQRPNRHRMDEIERLYEEIVAAKNELVRANLRLVVAIAKRYLRSQEQFFDLVSDGNMSLMRAVEKFDYALGNKFSTYASWAIRKNYARAFARHMQYSDRFRTSLDEVLCQKSEYRADPYERETAQALRVHSVGRLLGCLEEREREIISHRFGLEPAGKPQTLQEVGDKLGLTKERIRQLETRAMDKLRRAAQQAGMECPAA